MIENEIMPGVDLNIILSINCDKYAERVLNYNPPRSQKIKDLNKSLGNHEVNNPNDRDSLLRCFHENNNWKTPSKEDKKNFPLWREDHFDRLQKYFKSKLDDDEMPMEYWKNWESSRVLDLLNEQPYFTVFYNIATRQLTQDFFLLAHVIGMIDHLKAVQKLTGLKEDDNVKYKKLSEVFTDNNYEKALALLLNAKPPIISKEEGIYIYKSGPRGKSNIKAWFDVISEEGYLKQIEAKDLSVLLNLEFKTLNLGALGRTLEGIPMSPGVIRGDYKKYYQQFKADISNSSKSYLQSIAPRN